MRVLAGALISFALAGCGGSSGSTPSAELDRFVGTWTVTSGVLKATCPALAAIPVMNQLMGDQQTVVRGTDSDLAFNVQPKCKLLLDVMGDTATVRPKQTCTVSAGMFEVPGTVNSGTLVLDSTGATFDIDGEAALGTSTCTFNASGSSTKTP